MKKLLAILILSISLIGIGNAQTTGKLVSSGTVWTDSLGYGVVATSDSVWILDVNFAYDWFRIFVEGNANSAVDSIIVQAGSVRYNESKAAVDTVWGSYSTLKDSTWESINTIVNNSTGKDFTLFNPGVQLLRFSLMNYRAVLVTRNVVITVNGIRR